MDVPVKDNRFGQMNSTRLKLSYLILYFISLFYFTNFWCLRCTSSETWTLHSLLMSQRLCPTPLFGAGLYICHTAFPHAWKTVWGHMILYSTAETTVHVKSSLGSFCGLVWSFMCYMLSGRRWLWAFISSCFGGS